MAASMLVDAIQNYVTGFDDSSFKEICQRLVNREINLTEVAENLGVYLTSKETAVRARGTRLVAEILNNLPSGFLSQKEGSFLTVYLCERLQDHHSLQPHALYGLLALSKCSSLPDDSVEQICRTIFKEVHCQALPQGDRRSIFTIFSTFLHTKLPELQKLGADFVYGFITMMDGEKDPRNLVLAFQCARIVIENFPLGVFTEEMFEVVSCYFPVDFKPSETDPSGITQEDLIIGLRQCLAASPQFAQYCLPLLLEKLTSDLKSAKIDALKTLSVCAEVYGSSSLQEFQSSFFNCIKKEVFLSGDPAMEEAALSALTALVKALSTGIIEVGTKRDLEGFVEEILTVVHVTKETGAFTFATGTEACQALGGSVATWQPMSGGYNEGWLHAAACCFMNTGYKYTSLQYPEEGYHSGLNLCSTEDDVFCTLQEIKQHLLQPELMLMLSTGRLLGAAALGSSMACCQILNTTVPMLLEVHDRHTETTPKYNVLQVITGFIESASSFKSSSQCLDALLQFRDQLLCIYISAVKEGVPLIQQQVVRGFKALFSFPKLLTENSMTTIAKTLLLKVCDKDLDVDVRQKSNELFQFISSIQTEVILKSLMYAVFPLVIRESSEVEKHLEICNNGDQKMESDEVVTDDRHNERVTKSGDASVIRDSEEGMEIVDSDFRVVTVEEKAQLLTENIEFLQTLAAVCTQVAIVKVVTKFLLEYLFYCKGSSVETCRAIFQCFTIIVDNSDTESQEYLFSKIVPAIYSWVMTHCHATEWQDRVKDNLVLGHIASFLRKTVTQLSSKCTSIFPAAYSSYCVSLYLDGDFKSIMLDSLPQNSKIFNQKFTPLLAEEDSVYVCLLTPILCSGPPKVEIPRGREFIDRLCAASKTVMDITAHTHVIKCLAGLLNKWKQEEDVSNLLENIKSYVETTLQSCVDSSIRSRAISCWSWITKALVLRNHKQSNSFTNKLIDLLADMSVGVEAAAGIATILTPCDDVMTKEMSANIRMMYRQRFFIENLPKLAKGFESANEECKKNYLLAVSHLIKDMDKQVLMPELDKVFPLLIHSLQCEDISLQLSTMLTLGDLIQNAPELVHKQIDSLIPKLLKLTTYRPSMKVRIAALNCLEEMTTLPVHMVIPYRRQVTRALEKVLDDPKRLVRKQAVSARQEWYLLDTKSK